MGNIKKFIVNCFSASARRVLLDGLKPLIFGFAMGGMLQASGASQAEEAEPLGKINDYLLINGELLGGFEAWNYFQPSPAINNNNDYNLWVLRARLGAQLTTSFIDGYAQAQYIGMYGLPNDAVSVPGGPLGLGAAYFSANGSVNADNVFLKQAFLNFKFEPLGLPGTFLKVGRFNFLDGMEYQSGDMKFDGLKRMRIAQRLVGSFAVHATRSFDGFSVVHDQPAFNITAGGFRPTQGGFTVQGQDEISDIDLFYAALTSKKGALLPDTEGRIFYTYYNDDRTTQVVDNRPVRSRPNLDRENLELHTLGTHMLTVQQWGSGSVDGLLWGAYQFGNWTNEDHRAWAVDAEAGYQWTKLPLMPWLRAIYYRSSGDDNPNDGKHTTFFSMLPSGRIFAKFPFYNLMNLQDAFVELSIFPIPKTKVSINFHQLSLAKSNDLFYQGLGATVRSGAFGFAGRPSGGESDVGQLLDISFRQQLTKELSWRFYYGHAFGGRVLKNFYRGKKDADTAWVDFNLMF